MALARRAALAAVRTAARLFGDKSMGAGPVQAGLVVVRWETGTTGGGGRLY